MPRDRIEPPPESGSVLRWAKQNPGLVRDLVREHNALRDLEVQLVTPGGNNRGKESLVFGDDNVVLPLPYKFTRPISDSTATAASVSTQLNLLLAELRKTGMLPTA